MQRELTTAVEAARRAGAAIREVYARTEMTVVEKADDAGPLTEADLASNAILADALRTAFPADGWLSEESADDPSRLGKERVWIVDPLDGTREFTLRIPEFVVSIGLAVHGQPVLGVLYNPIRDELFTGIVCGEATFQSQAMRVSPNPSIAGSRCLVSRNEMEKGWFDEWKDAAALLPMGSVAYKLGRVAAGQAEASFTPKPRSEWDLCGGVACVLAAGGSATDRHGAPYRFNTPAPRVDGVVVSNGHLHPEILALLRNR